MKTLSICIPSYNRFEVLNETLNSILKAKSYDFEIVIIDNCSPRDPEKFINIRDERIKIIKREKAVYGAKNVGDAVSFANGKYALLLLDKDFIAGEYLDEFIQYLSDSEELGGGYCALNSENNEIKIHDEDALLEFGYLSKHPSGDFYNIDILREYIDKKSCVLRKEPFIPDIYRAYCASLKKMMIYDKPLVFSLLDKESDCKDSVSLTYKEKYGNVYYFPTNRINEFIVYSDCLNELYINKYLVKKTLNKLFVRTAIHVTIEFKHIMTNKFVCYHYGHETTNVTFIDMIKYYLALRKAFYDFHYKNISDIEKLEVEISLIKKIIVKCLNKLWKK